MKDEKDPGTLDIEAALTAVAVEVHDREQSVQQLYLDAAGRERPNPTPMQPPIGYKRPPTIQETMRQMIRQASVEAALAGAETEEEANDFDMDEEWEPGSQWEHPFDPDPALEAMIALHSKPPARGDAAAPAPGGTAPAVPPAPPSSPAKPASGSSAGS